MHAHNWTYINIYNKEIQDVSIISCFCYERLCLKKKKTLFKQIVETTNFVYFQIEIEPNSTTYICTSCLYNIYEDKSPIYQVTNKNSRNTIIPLT